MSWIYRVAFLVNLCTVYIYDICKSFNIPTDILLFLVTGVLNLWSYQIDQNILVCSERCSSKKKNLTDPIVNKPRSYGI